MTNIIKCRFISPDAAEKYITEGETYFGNNVEITSNGKKTICCSDEILRSLAEHINDKSLSFINKEIVFGGKETKYKFKGDFDKETTTTVIITIPKELENGIYSSIIRQNMYKLDKLVNKTKQIETLENIKDTITIAVIGVALLLAGNQIKKNIKTTEPEKPKNAYSYYENTDISSDQIYAIAENLQNAANKANEKGKTKHNK